MVGCRRMDECDSRFRRSSDEQTEGNPASIARSGDAEAA